MFEMNPATWQGACPVGSPNSFFAGSSADHVVVVFCRHPPRLNRVRDALANVSPSIGVARWDELEAMVGRCRRSVVCATPHELIDRRSRIQAILLRNPQHSMLLVTDPHPDALRELVNLHLSAIIWWRELDTRLGEEVRAAGEERLLEWVAARIEANDAISVLLKKGLSLACRSDAPFISVSELARAVDRDRRTLWRHWQKSAPAHQSFSLETVLSWIALLHAVQLKRTGRSWSVVASKIGTNTSTLGRWSRSVLGMGLRDLAVRPVASITATPLARAIADHLLAGL